MSDVVVRMGFDQSSFARLRGLREKLKRASDGDVIALALDALEMLTDAQLTGHEIFIEGPTSRRKIAIAVGQ